MLKILLTVLVFVIVMFLITKKLNAATSLFLVALVAITIYAFVTEGGIGGTSGSTFIDVFELAKSKFASQASGTGLLIMSVMGYVKYMETIKASQLLALTCARPLKKFGKPYLVVAGGIIIGAFLKLCVPSHSGLVTLLMATLYPVFLACGVRNLTAAAAVVIAGSFDLGPACPITGWATQQEPVAALTSISNFFVNYQILPTVIIIAVTIVVFLLTSKKADAKDTNAQKEAEEIDPKSLGIPGFYCFLPLIPLILVLIFSDLFKVGAVISVVAANFLGFVIAFIINMIIKSKGNFVKAFNESDAYWKGMGYSFGSVISVIAAASVFSAALDYIGGAKMLMAMAGNSSAGGYVVVIVAMLVNFLVAFLTGSGVAASYTVIPMLYAIPNINLLVAVLGCICAGGLGRGVSPVCGAVLMVAGASDFDPVTLVKRTAIPILCGLASGMIFILISL